MLLPCRSPARLASASPTVPRRATEDSRGLCRAAMGPDRSCTLAYAVTWDPAGVARPLSLHAHLPYIVSPTAPVSQEKMGAVRNPLLGKAQGVCADRTSARPKRVAVYRARTAEPPGATKGHSRQGGCRKYPPGRIATARKNWRQARDPGARPLSHLAGYVEFDRPHATAATERRPTMIPTKRTLCGSGDLMGRVLQSARAGEARSSRPGGGRAVRDGTSTAGQR